MAAAVAPAGPIWPAAAWAVAASGAAWVATESTWPLIPPQATRRTNHASGTPRRSHIRRSHHARQAPQGAPDIGRRVFAAHMIAEPTPARTARQDGIGGRARGRPASAIRR